MTVKSQEGIEGDTRTVRTVSEGQNGQKSIGRGRLSKTYALQYVYAGVEETVGGSGM